MVISDAFLWYLAVSFAAGAVVAAVVTALAVLLRRKIDTPRIRLTFSRPGTRPTNGKKAVVSDGV